MFDIFYLEILEGGIFILFLYVCFSKLLFSPFMNTDFPKRSLFSLIVIVTLQVASHLKYGDDFHDADFLK